MIVNMVHMDPHSLSLPAVESVMQLDFLATDQEHIVEFSEPEKPLSEPQPVTSVQGRLWENSKFWIYELEGSQFVIDIITHGYHLPFLAFPPAVCARNHKSAFEHADFVSEAIQELVDSSCAVRVPACPSPLQVGWLSI